MPRDLVNAKGERACEPDQVAERLDATEDRFFGDAFSVEKRWADRSGSAKNWLEVAGRSGRGGARL
jgi:hypothetical protein